MHVAFTDGDLRSCPSTGKPKEPQVAGFVPCNFWLVR